MTGWLEGILINKSIYRNFGSMAVFRFHLDYVNRIFLCCFHNMLHNQHLQGVGGDGVITYISAVLEIMRFGHKF